MVLGHPPLYAPGDISMSEAVSTTHQALSQAQRALRHEGEDIADERLPLSVGKHAQADGDVREGSSAGLAAWFRLAGGGHRPM
jgi:hypothetical protein